MEHPDYPESLECGCICAGAMEENPRRAHERELYARRHDRFDKRKGWKKLESGSYLLKVDRYAILAFRRGDGWKLRVEHSRTKEFLWGTVTHPDIKTAKRAGLHALTAAKKVLKEEHA
ncbi:hypothetical protein B9J07_13605 [Sinorhizobium sp. LM21]|nr:hypothetical protein B9J07_13605 [Sinorhizobium sp. LM21]